MEITTEILALRPYLFSISYGMLGVIEEAEDIVQDVFEKWMAVEHAANPKAYLARMAVNKSINRQGELKTIKENYTGTWLPEPYIHFEQETGPTIEYGLLFLLEKLNPVERAVFILRESFSEEYDAIAELTGLTIDNCRQHLHRAHEKLGRNVTRQVDPLHQAQLTEAFLLALRDNDMTVLNRLLVDEIELYGDGGGKRSAALKPLFGLQKVVKFLLGVTHLPENPVSDFEYRPAYVNGFPAALLFRTSTGELDSMQYVVVDQDQVIRLLFVRNPDKLRIAKMPGEK